MDTERVYKAALYLRLSKDDTDIDGSIKKESNSIANQKALILKTIMTWKYSGFILTTGIQVHLLVTGQSSRG